MSTTLVVGVIVAVVLVVAVAWYVMQMNSVVVTVDPAPTLNAASTDLTGLDPPVLVVTEPSDAPTLNAAPTELVEIVPPPPPAPAHPANSFLGCYADAVPPNRVFGEHYMRDGLKARTKEACRAIANNLGEKYYGMQYSEGYYGDVSECWVGLKDTFDAQGPAFNCGGNNLGGAMSNAVYST